MRQYWRDIDSLERWTRSEPHQRWWRDFLKDSGGTGFWHEAYFMAGGAEAIYDDMAAPMGFAREAGPGRPASLAGGVSKTGVDVRDPSSENPDDQGGPYGEDDGGLPSLAKRHELLAHDHR
jgi:hypothetical protein